MYAMYPMQTPQKMKQVLEKRGQVKNFSFEPPSMTPSWKLVQTWKAVTETLENHEEFKVTCELRNVPVRMQIADDVQ